MRVRRSIPVLFPALLAALAFFVLRHDHTASSRAIPVARILGETGDDAGYARADKMREFVFPADHGAHPEFRNEWWYFTGNLRTAEGRRFGYQLTFFRFALSPQTTEPLVEAIRGEPVEPRTALMPERVGVPHAPFDRLRANGSFDQSVNAQSVWRTNQLYLAHFALTDVEGKRFHAFERSSRAALGLSGAKTEPFAVWIDDWSARSERGAFAPRLRAAAEQVALDLQLIQGKPVVLQGDKGLSKKGQQAGNASYYYSLTRMPTTGTITVDGSVFKVEGTSWMDREWSTSALEPDQVGWDWFALQLDDGHELMFYRLRRRDGSVDPNSASVFVGPDGTTLPLGHNQLIIDTLTQWESSRSDVRYPAQWRLSVPTAGLNVEIEPLLEAQELDLSVRYWEGAVRVHGRRQGEPITGVGYVELVGYEKQ